MDPVIGEIRTFAGAYVPENWLPCDGRALPIQNYQALYSLIGTTYGGDGRITFNLPDLRGRLPVGQGQGTGLTSRVLGQAGGTATVPLTSSQIPAHTHTFSVSLTQGSTNVPTAGAMLAVPQQQAGGTMQAYAPPAAGGTALTFADTSIAVSGGGQPHDNLMPYLGITFIIAANGLFPSRP